jgi:multidrug transporter EmrE-like cation transporter
MALIDISMMGTLKLVDQGKVAYALGFPIATLLYAFEPYVFLKAMTHSNMVVTNLIWNLASNILVTLAGVFFFGESIKGLKWLAIGMSLFSLAIFAYSE